MWQVEFTEEFEAWWDSLNVDQQQAVKHVVELLMRDGPNLRRPYVGTLVGSQLSNLKELRCSENGVLRVLFAFDPRRSAILLLGGDKTGQWEEWYREAIPQAERLYAEYLDELRSEGLI